MRDKPEAWEVWVNLGLILGFLFIAVVADKFMLVRNSLLRRRHYEGGHAVANRSASASTYGTRTTSLLDLSSRRESGGHHMSPPPRNTDTKARTPKSGRSRNRHSFLGRSSAAFGTNASFGSTTTTPESQPGNNHSFSSSQSGEDLESLAENALREQEEQEVDISRIFTDGITVFYLLSTLYGLLMATISGFILLSQSATYTPQLSGGQVGIITGVPVVCFYSIVAALCEKLFSLFDITKGGVSRRTKFVRRTLLALLATTPFLTSMILTTMQNPPIPVEDLTYFDICSAVVFGALLTVGGYLSNRTGGVGTHEQRRLCAYVSAVSALSVLLRAAALLPTIQKKYYQGTSILFQFFVFNVATIAPVVGALLVLKWSPKK